MSEKKLIGVYGGTFNPPHFGHVIAVKEARRMLGLDRVIVIPAAIPPHKRTPENTPPAGQRYEMARIAFEDIEFAEVSDIEIMREGPSYTVDTLWQLHELYIGAELCLIVGADMFMTLHTWYMAEEIFSLCRVAALSRAAEQTGELKKQAGFLLERYGIVCEVLENPVVEISSSELREKIRNGEASRFLQPRVYDYIAEKGLYR